MTAVAHAAIVLAAGASRRLGTAKQLLCVDDETLLHRVTRLVLSTRPAETRVVLGHDVASIAPAVADLPARIVVCADWARGLGASLAAGLAGLPDECAGALVVVCDQTDLDAGHLAALVAAWRTAPGRAAASRYAGVLGVPAVLPRRWFARLCEGSDDRGARALLRAEAPEVSAIDAPELAADLDTPADVRRWQADGD